MKKIVFVLSALFFAAVIFTGCRSSLIVRDKPYAPMYQRPPAPGPHYVWVTGEWVTRKNGYVYRRGYWARQRMGHTYYISGHWQSRRNGWAWVPGHWR